MRGFCTDCGQPLDGEGKCPTCQFETLSAAAPVVLEATPQQAVAPLPANTPAQGVGPLPKASTARRLLGSGIEYLVYVTAVFLLSVFSPFTAGTLGFVTVPLLLGMVGLRDTNAGALSIGKRVGGMRVVDRHSGQPASNGQAVVRNSYYLGLLVLMFIPMIKFIFSTLFAMMVFIDVMMIVANPSGRRFGDILGGTQVVPEARS